MVQAMASATLPQDALTSHVRTVIGNLVTWSQKTYARLWEDRLEPSVAGRLRSPPRAGPSGSSSARQSTSMTSASRAGPSGSASTSRPVPGPPDASSVFDDDVQPSQSAVGPQLTPSHWSDSAMSQSSTAGKTTPAKVTKGKRTQASRSAAAASAPAAASASSSRRSVSQASSTASQQASTRSGSARTAARPARAGARTEDGDASVYSFGFPDVL